MCYFFKGFFNVKLRGTIVYVRVHQELNNYKDTKPWMSSLLVFYRVYRLENTVSHVGIFDSVLWTTAPLTFSQIDRQNSLQLMLVFMSWLFYVHADLHTRDCTFAVWTWYLYYTKLQSTSYKTNPSLYILECKFEGLYRIFYLLLVVSERLNPQ